MQRSCIMEVKPPMRSLANARQTSILEQTTPVRFRMNRLVYSRRFRRTLQPLCEIAVVSLMLVTWSERVDINEFINVSRTGLKPRTSTVKQRIGVLSTKERIIGSIVDVFFEFRAPVKPADKCKTTFDKDWVSCHSGALQTWCDSVLNRDDGRTFKLGELCGKAAFIDLRSINVIEPCWTNVLGIQANFEIEPVESDFWSQVVKVRNVLFELKNIFKVDCGVIRESGASLA
jgi:hypothetical protein